MYCKGEAYRRIQWETQALKPWAEEAWLRYSMCHQQCLHRTFAHRGSATGSYKTFRPSLPLTRSLPGFPGGWDIRHLHLIASISLCSQCSEDEALRRQCVTLGWNRQSISWRAYLRASSVHNVFLSILFSLEEKY